jgi:hypothetical protein
VLVFCKLAQILDIYVDQARFARAPHDAVIKRAGEKLRENRNEVEAHALSV